MAEASLSRRARARRAISKFIYPGADVLKGPAVVLGSGDLVNFTKGVGASLAVDTGGSVRQAIRGETSGTPFGKVITDNDREWAAYREPIGVFVIFHVSGDVFKGWFEINDPSTEEQDPDLNRRFQKRLTELKAKTVLTRALELERLYGYSLIVGRFDDAETRADLAKPKKEGANLVELQAYSRKTGMGEYANKLGVTSVVRDKNPASERYGEIEIYKMDLGGGGARVSVHHSRVHRFATRSKERSVIDGLHDDLMTFRNMRWALGQFLWRIGPGFPKLTFPKGFTMEQLLAFKNAGLFADLMQRSYILLPADYEFEFVGAQGVTVNPLPYLKPITETISAGARIPEPILRGAQAGALTGSEVNERDYWDGLISSIQSAVEDAVRAVIDWAMAGSGEVDIGDPELAKIRLLAGDVWDRIKGEFDAAVLEYEIVWLGGYEIGEETRARAELYREQSNVLRLNYQEVDEVRVLNEKDPLPGGVGKVVPGIEKLSQVPGGFGGFDLADQVAMPTLAGSLKALVENVKSGELSVDQAKALAEAIINDYIRHEEARALLWIQARTGEVVPSLPASERSRLDALRDKYLEDFATILADAISAEGGGLGF